MMNIKEEMIQKIIKNIEGSELWIELNERVKKVYEAYGRIPSEEEYQMTRNMIICKVIMDDENILKGIC